MMLFDQWINQLSEYWYGCVYIHFDVFGLFLGCNFFHLNVLPQNTSHQLNLKWIWINQVMRLMYRMFLWFQLPLTERKLFYNVSHLFQYISTEMKIKFT